MQTEDKVVVSSCCLLVGRQCPFLLGPHFIICVERVIKILWFESCKARRRSHRASDRLTESECAKACTSRFGERRRQATEDREAVHHSCHGVIAQIFFKRWPPVDVCNEPRPIWFYGFTDGTNDSIRIRHIVETVKCSNKVKTLIIRQGITVRIM